MYPPLNLRRGGRSHRRRLLAFIATPVLGLSLLAATPSPAAMVTTADEASSPMAAESTRLPVDAEPVTITLITGDRVSVTQTTEGEWQMSQVEPARRPDGSVPGFDAFGMTGEGSYVLPEDVRPLIAEDLLDVELFNVGYLAENGYADEDRGDLPVIVEYADSMSTTSLERDARRLPASEQTVTLDSIDSAGVAVDKDDAPEFWAAIAGGDHTAGGSASQSAELLGGVEKVWLDQVAYVSLDESVPQVGAPQAWDAGFTGEGVMVAVLDTGIDADHPDLVGKVVATENFTTAPDVSDTVGHGTHVAATIAGSGAASDGARRGVAPDTELVVGKVCPSDTCPFSAIMAGMEWAARDQGADVVNMSLGTLAASDGLDLQSQLVNQLTEETGALFVTSAGNTGPGSPSVGSPAAADAALAVGAVDKGDQLAEFSSRGPRVGDRAIKPEITAPGVGIVAARAAGTSLGTPVDEKYTSLNGTSMASPHVAGAAAILAQQHPDWGPDELKAALVSSATTTGQLGGTITSGPYEGTTYTVSSGSNSARIDTAISGTPTFVGHGCDEPDAGEGIALVERGPADAPCSFQDKLDNIVAAGYSAGIVFNQPGADCLDEVVMQADGDIPFVFVNRPTGLQLLQQPDLTDPCAAESPEPGSGVASTTIEPGAAGDYTVYQQGAGRLDVARAVSNEVQVSPATADFRFVPFDQEQSPEPQTLTYTNPTDEPVTLDLSFDLRAVGGDPVPAGVLALDRESLTVPVGGTATVTATLDHTTLDSGQYGGQIVAADEATGIQLTTPVGFVRGHELHQVTATIETAEGQALVGPSPSQLCPPFCSSLLFPVDIPFVQDVSYRPASISCVQGDEDAVTCRKYELSFVVPAGTYNLLMTDLKWARGTGTDPTGFSSANFVRPSIAISGDTEIAFHTTTLRKTTPRTHRPSQAVTYGAWLAQRQTDSAGGAMQWSASSTGSATGAGSTGSASFVDELWVTPTEPPTVGELNIGSNWHLVNRLVEMSVVQPERFDLTTATYPDYRPIELAGTEFGAGSVRFSGRQTLPVVDVGAGSAEDLAGHDVAGSLVLMHVEPTEDPPRTLGECAVRAEQLRNALNAGAAGVLIANPHGKGYCSIRPGTRGFGHNDIDIPWVSLSVAEADRLRSLVKEGPVTIRVTDRSDDEYAYFLSFIERDGIPDSLPYTVGEEEITEHQSHYHRSKPGVFVIESSTFWPDYARGMAGAPWIRSHLLAPTVRTEYFGPRRHGDARFSRLAGPNRLNDARSGWLIMYSHELLTDDHSHPSRWGDVPVVPGAAIAPFTKVDAGTQAVLCSGCRVGNFFVPFWMRTWPDPALIGEQVTGYRPLRQQVDTVRLTRNGEEIPLTTINGWLPAFELPKDHARYLLTLETAGQRPEASTTTWEFSSGQVDLGNRPEGVTHCAAPGVLETEPCRAEPLVYLRYDAGVDLNNTVPAQGAHRMKVTAYHQDPDGPAIAGFKLWTSTDGGDKWRSAKVRPLSAGGFEVIAMYPPAHRRASDTVSIKAEAWDADGNRVEQMLPYAYTLRDRGLSGGSNHPN